MGSRRSWTESERRSTPSAELLTARPLAPPERVRKNAATMVVDFQSVSPETVLGPLDEIERRHAPDRLYLAGEAALLTQGIRVSVVGSRRASSDGVRRAVRLSRMLVERGIIVVSGLAEGIDTAAHKAAIEASGRTVAVLGTSLDRFSPGKNRPLQELIMKEHLAVSQFAPGQSLGRKGFPMRNRTMALLSDATVIVQAGEKSGTIYQGWEALRLGRPLFIMDSLFRAGLPWVEEMVHSGASVLSNQTTELFFDALPEESRVERAHTSF